MKSCHLGLYWETLRSTISIVNSQQIIGQKHSQQIKHGEWMDWIEAVNKSVDWKMCVFFFFFTSFKCMQHRGDAQMSSVYMFTFTFTNSQLHIASAKLPILAPKNLQVPKPVTGTLHCLVLNMSRTDLQETKSIQRCWALQSTAKFSSLSLSLDDSSWLGSFLTVSETLLRLEALAAFNSIFFFLNSSTFSRYVLSERRTKKVKVYGEENRVTKKKRMYKIKAQHFIAELTFALLIQPLLSSLRHQSAAQLQWREWYEFVCKSISCRVQTVVQGYKSAHLFFFQPIIDLLQVLLDQLFKFFVLISTQQLTQIQGHNVFMLNLLQEGKNKIK